MDTKRSQKEAGLPNRWYQRGNLVLCKCQLNGSNRNRSDRTYQDKRIHQNPQKIIAFRKFYCCSHALATLVCPINLKRSMVFGRPFPDPAVSGKKYRICLSMRNLVENEKRKTYSWAASSSKRRIYLAKTTRRPISVSFPLFEPLPGHKMCCRQWLIRSPQSRLYHEYGSD